MITISNPPKNAHAYEMISIITHPRNPYSVSATRPLFSLSNKRGHRTIINFSMLVKYKSRQWTGHRLWARVPPELAPATTFPCRSTHWSLRSQAAHTRIIVLVNTGNVGIPISLVSRRYATLHALYLATYLCCFVLGRQQSAIGQGPGWRCLII